MHDFSNQAAPPWDPDAFPTVRGIAYWKWIVPQDAVFYSREWLRILQSDDEAHLGPSTASWWPLVHEDDVLPFVATAKQIAEGECEEYQTLLRIRRANGTWVWLLSRGSVTRRHAGKAVELRGFIIDISNLRTDVKFLHGFQDNLPGDAMLVNSPDLLVRMDKQLTPLFNNSRVARYLAQGGHNPEKATFEDSQAVDPLLVLFLQDNVGKVFATGNSSRKQVTFPTAYGHEVIGEYSFWPEIDAYGQVAAVMTQFRDLTEQILAERRARLNEMRLEALYHLTHLDSADKSDVFAFTIESLTQLTGSEAGFLFFPQGELDGTGEVVWSRHFHETVPKEFLSENRVPVEILRQVVEDFNDVRSKLENGNGFVPIISAFGGSFLLMRYILVPVKKQEKIDCIACIFNKEIRYEEDDLQQAETFISNAWLVMRKHSFINELRQAKEVAEQANKALNSAKESAEYANKVKDFFLANVSHELRTPLNGILGMLQLLEDSHLDTAQMEYVHTASTSGQGLLRIISDILDFSRMEAGKFELRNEVIDIKDTISSALRLFKLEAAHRGLDFTLDTDEAIPSLVYGDDARVRQILYNLVGNAFKFTEHGGVTVKCALLPQKQEGKVSVSIDVTDTGIGIPRNMQHRIFEAFTQLAHAAIQKNPGTGLGLSIVKRILDLMGGAIEVQSDVGIGTLVKCILNFDEASTLSLAADPQEYGAEQMEYAPEIAMDILVAEDDPTSRFTLARFLEKAGHRPVCVENGLQALEAMRLYRFHCIFTDIQMPRMDGLELISRIRENRISGVFPSEETRALLRQTIPGEYVAFLPVTQDIPAVSVSAHAMSGDKRRFLEAGMDYYVAKPILFKEVQGVLRQINRRLMNKNIDNAGGL